MREMYLWKITFGNNWDSIHIVTPDDDIKGVLGAGISYSKEAHDYTDEGDEEPGMEVTEIERIREVLLVDLTEKGQ